VDIDSGILAGHARLLAVQSLGLDTVPVLVLRHPTAVQRRAYILADNKLALNAGWDEELLPRNWLRSSKPSSSLA
jgi:ParB-like chromosome segregation protein Spo0J